MYTVYNITMYKLKFISIFKYITLSTYLCTFYISFKYTYRQKFSMVSCVLQSLKCFTGHKVKEILTLRQRNLRNTVCSDLSVSILRFLHCMSNKALQRPQQKAGPCRTFVLKYIWVQFQGSN